MDLPVIPNWGEAVPGQQISPPNVEVAEANLAFADKISIETPGLGCTGFSLTRYP